MGGIPNECNCRTGRKTRSGSPEGGMWEEEMVVGWGKVREREKRDYVVYTEQTGGGAVLLVE